MLSAHKGKIHITKIKRKASEIVEDMKKKKSDDSIWDLEIKDLQLGYLYKMHGEDLINRNAAKKNLDLSNPEHLIKFLEKNATSLENFDKNMYIAQYFQEKKLVDAEIVKDTIPGMDSYIDISDIYSQYKNYKIRKHNIPYSEFIKQGINLDFLKFKEIFKKNNATDEEDEKL